MTHAAARKRWNYVKAIEDNRIVHVEVFCDDAQADIAAIIERAKDYSEQVALCRRPVAPLPPGSRIGFAMGCEGQPCLFLPDHGDGKVCARCHAKAAHVPHLKLAQ